MVREYEMVGAMPVIVGGYGRVEPGAGKFRCEMEPSQEAFLVRIGAVRVLRDLPGEVVSPLPLVPAEGQVEFEGRKLDFVPSGWPIRPPDEEEG